jgi:threonine dehydrogenase-like Zn-dependent dehydrogenase
MSPLATPLPPSFIAFRLASAISDTDASGAVVAQVGYNAASRAMFDVGDWVLVYGNSLIGQCAAQAARARGTRVILVGHHTQRLALARQFSADAVINNREAEPILYLDGHGHAWKRRLR